MFIVIGIASILSGLYVLNRAIIFFAFAQLFHKMPLLFIAFWVISLGFIAAGVLSLASKMGKNRRLIRISSWIYCLVLVASSYFATQGDLLLWAVLSAGFGLIYSAWLRFNNPLPENITESPDKQNIA